MLDLLDNKLLPQLSQINNWPRHTESVPHTLYIETDTAVDEIDHYREDNLAHINIETE